MQEYIIVKKEDNLYINIVYRILFKCGINLALKGLFHWIPPYPKRCIKRDCEKRIVYLVRDYVENDYTSTFQVHVREGCLDVFKLATLPKYEGHGIGGKNLRFIEDYAISQGCSRISFDVYAKSELAIMFYRNHGYKEVGEKHSIRFKEIIMEKSLV